MSLVSQYNTIHTMQSNSSPPFLEGPKFSIKFLSCFPEYIIATEREVLMALGFLFAGVLCMPECASQNTYKAKLMTRTVYARGS